MRRIFLLANLCLAFGLTAPRILFAESGLIFDQTQGMLTGQLNVSSNIVAAGSVTASSATFTNTAGVGLTVNSSAYLAVSGGKVGIGTAAPEYKFDVAGTLHASGDTTLSGNLAVTKSEPGLTLNSTGESVYQRLIFSQNGGSAVSLLGYANSILFMYAGGFHVNPTSFFQVNSNGYNPILSVPYVANIVDYLSFAGGISGSNATTISALGTDSNINIIFSPKGNGNVGIGTTNPGALLHLGSSYNLAGLPSNTKFVVDGSGTDNAWATKMVLVPQSNAAIGGVVASYFDNVNEISKLGFGTIGYGGVEQTMVLQKGNVGIGTASPGALLHITGATPYLLVDANNASLGQAGVKLIAGNGSTNRATRIDFLNSIISTSVPRWTVLNDYNQDGTNDFALVNAANSRVLDILQSGNVGIGTTSPGARLHVNAYDGTYNQISAILHGGEAWGGGVNRVQMRSGAGAGVIYTEFADIIGASGAGADLSIKVADSSNVLQNRVTIQKDGNVGIGTTGPAATLHVLGPTTGTNLPVAIFDKNYGQPGDPSTALRMTLNAGAGGGYFFGYNGEAAFAHNAEYISGTGWVARQTTASLIDQTAGNIFLYGNTGLTMGNVFTPAIRLAVLANGNVGIGTTGPGTPLDIVSPGAAWATRGVRLLGPNMAAGSGNSLMISVGQADSEKNMGQMYFYYTGSGSTSNRLSFGLHSVDDVLNVLGTGNVGIGTTAPGSKLEINLTGYTNDNAANAFRLTYNGSPRAMLGVWGGEGELSLYRSSTARTVFISSYYDSYINAGNVGIGTTAPGQRLTVDNAHGEPATSGTVQNGVFRVQVDNGAGWGEVLDMGMHIGLTGPPSYAWIQATNKGNFTINYNLALNPNAGNVGIGTTSPGTYKLYINGTGYLNAAAWAYSSDRRLKENIAYINGGLAKIMQLKPASFDYIDGAKDNLGFIAQDVQKVIPEAVSITDPKTGMLGLKTDFIIPFLTRAIQEQQPEIERLKSDDATLKSDNAALKSEVSSLKERLNQLERTLQPR